MKKTLTTLICATIALYCLSPLNASARVKKNEPDKRDVAKFLEELGGEHFVKYMRVKNFCTLEFEGPDEEEIYYHVLVGTLRGSEGYHIIIYDNKPEYLGFYYTTLNPEDYEKDRIKLDSGDANNSGDSVYIALPLTVKGPADTVNIDGIPTKFVKNPNLTVEEKNDDDGDLLPVVPKETSVSGEVIDYREWKITMKGKEISVNAKFEKIEGGKIYIKNAKNGAVAAIPGSALSPEDQEYVKRISAK
ncbi:hypothetical protein P4E94_00860 [Pontiellaceae bacterium B12219]|nr:hypothetical protein [Pontiellaceae bacterium B12219]